MTKLKKLEELKKEIERRANKPIVKEGLDSNYHYGFRDALKWVLEKFKEIENEKANP